MFFSTFSFVPPAKKAQAASWLTGWSYRKQITASNTNVGTDLSNFPLLVKIAETGGGSTNIGNNVSDTANGHDIRFTDSDGTTLLSYERESFSVASSNLTANFWVKVPMVSHSATTDIYIYYGNSGQTSSDWTTTTGSGDCSAITQSQCVWKEGTPQNFKGVWHSCTNETVSYGSSMSGYGDSIMAGVGASDAAHRFLNLVAVNNKIAPLSWTVDNQGNSGKEIADIASSNVYPDVVSSPGKSMALVGYNDMRHYGTNAGGQTTFEKILYAMSAWLAIPHTSKITGQGAGVTYSGAWTNESASVYGGGLGKYTSETNAYAEFSVTGTAVYVGLTALTLGTGGTYKIEVDSVEKATGNAYGLSTPISTLQWAPILVRIPGLSSGTHTVRVTNTGGTGTKNIYFDWAAGNGNTTNFFLGNTLKMNATGYASASPWNNGSDVAVGQFNAIISGVASTLSGDGLKVHYVDANSLYNLSTDVGADNIHPNDSGNQHIADAFINTIDISTLTQATLCNSSNDSSQNSNILTEGGSGVTVVDGKVNGGLNTDASTTGYVKKSGATGLNVTNNFTIEGWFKPANLTQTNKFATFFGSNDGASHWDTIWEFTNNQIEFYSFGYSGLDPRTGSGITLSDTNWHHIAYIYNGTNWSYSLDGVNTVINANITFSLPQPSADNFTMGGSWNAGSFGAAQAVNADFDEWRISSTARSEDWIKFEYYNESSATNELTFAGQEAAPSTATLITSFNFTNPAATGVINNTNHTVALIVPYGTNITNLTPTIAVSTGATISPTSGTIENFTSPVVYTVTAQDTVTTQNYTVTVTVTSTPESSSTPASSTSSPAVSSSTGTAQTYLSTFFAYFVIPPSHAFDSPFTFDASGSYSINGITKYLWDFGDGTTSEEMKVDHQYQVPGRYTVTLTVTDKTGKTATQSQVVDAKPPAPTVESITADGTDLVFKGKSYPKTIIHLDIHSNPVSARTDTDEKGDWVYKMSDATSTLDKGDHTVLAKASFVLADKTELSSEPSKTYDFKVSLDDGKLKVEMGKTRTWQYISLGLGLLLIAGAGFVLTRAREKKRNKRGQTI